MEQTPDAPTHHRNGLRVSLWLEHLERKKNPNITHVQADK